MKTKIILRLLKAIVFIASLIAYGLTSGITSQILFAIALALFLMELYRGNE